MTNRATRDRAEETLAHFLIIALVVAIICSLFTGPITQVAVAVGLVLSYTMLAFIIAASWERYTGPPVSAERSQAQRPTGLSTSRIEAAVAFLVALLWGIAVLVWKPSHWPFGVACLAFAGVSLLLTVLPRKTTAREQQTWPDES
ncbi:hypothetical protein ACFL4Y_03750 [Gemmatimonadota bacterium]